MNEDIIKGKWKQLKGEAKKQWGKLTDDDIDYIDGQYEKLEGRLQERYGYSKEEARKEINSWQQ
ncbi:CsbD family protein [Oceanidesulfovibrio marinus]|uniref:CsbD family protein n=1 Tax=Oceanidesulfovibrio marinus TaxID=370038 RepID=A0A6P1ZHT1_9BACT|nr:CsbD family protein [Oceanidesulfovibrio marinus]QJT08068.1 CsbD family protein [Oceanidesulfovibrio marinus]TVM34884.1 CsbD family protein [Oceanidesulfovibrio marinus]